MMAAPMLEATTTELLALVADQMPGRPADSRAYLAEKAADLLCTGLMHKHRAAEGTSRVMI